MRIEKYLADMGFGSRKEVKQLITTGQVTLGGVTCRKVGTQVVPGQDEVQVAGQVVHYQRYYYYLLHKPQGIISATEDNQHRTVIDWLGEAYRHQDLFPVGRLDIDTTGLLLLTNNGQLAHQLLAPKKKVHKVYEATIQGLVDEQDIMAFETGLDLGDFVSQPAQLKVLSHDVDRQQSEVAVTIVEGKFHQVKRMFEAVGKRVVRLHRRQMGPLVLEDELPVGHWRELKPSEQKALEPFGYCAD